MKTTLLIPIHKTGEKEFEYLTKCFNSIKKQKSYIPNVLIVSPESNKKSLDIFLNRKDIKELSLPLKTKFHNEKSSFTNQVNLGVDDVETEFFTILEFDDEISENYTKNLEIYNKFYQDVSIFLYIVLEMTAQNQFYKFTNDICWSKSFSDNEQEIGYLTYHKLMDFSYFNLTGAAIKKEDFIASGKLKNNIKLTFNYEYLLRTTNLGYKVITIPKLGYLHRINRDGSLFEKYKVELTELSAKYWYNIAKKEHLFVKERPVIQNPEENEVK